MCALLGYVRHLVYTRVGVGRWSYRRPQVYARASNKLIIHINDHSTADGFRIRACI